MRNCRLICTLLTLTVALPVLAQPIPAAESDRGSVVQLQLDPIEPAPLCEAAAAAAESVPEVSPAGWYYGYCYTDCSRCETRWDCPLHEQCTSIPLC